MISRLMILVLVILTSSCGITEDEKKEVAYILDANLNSVKGVKVVDSAKMFSTLKSLNHNCDNSHLVNNQVIKDTLTYMAIGWNYNIEYEIGIQCIEKIALKDKELPIREYLLAAIRSGNIPSFKRLYTTFRYNTFAEMGDQFGFLEYSIAYCKKDFFDFLKSGGHIFKKTLWTKEQLMFFVESTCPEVVKELELDSSMYVD